MDIKEIVAEALEFASRKDAAEKDAAARRQIGDFLGRYPFKEKPELLRNIAPNDLFDSAAEDRFFNWVQDRTDMVGAIPVNRAAVFPEAVKRIDFFKVLLTVLVSDRKSISFKIDQNWGVIPGFGGDKLIAKKLVALYYADSVVPVFGTETLELFSSLLGIDYGKGAPQRFRKDYSMLSTGLKFELLNAGLMRFKTMHLEKWTNTMFASFLYHASTSWRQSSGAPATDKPHVEKEEAHGRGESTATPPAPTEHYEARLKESEAALNGLKEEVGARDARIAELEERLRMREEAMRTLEMEAHQREEAIREELLKETERLRSASPEQQAMRKRIEELTKQLKESDERIKGMEEEQSRRQNEAGVREIDFADMGIGMFEGSMPSETNEEKVKSGTPRLDDLLRGGIPVGSQVIVYGPSFIGKEIAMSAFAAQGLSEGVPLIWVTTDRTIEEIREEMSHFTGDYAEYEKKGLVLYIDAYSRIVGDSSVAEHVKYLDDSGDIASISEMVEECVSALGDTVREKGYRLLFRSVSSLSANFDIKNIFALLRPLVARIRKDRSVAIYSIERGIVSEQDLQIIGTTMDGVIEFSTDGRNNFLSVQGICETQTKDKIQYTVGKNALNIGSFTLGRIK